MGHDCQTVPEAAMASKKNGELLALAEETRFEVFLTIDRGIEYQHGLSKRKIAVILVRARSSRLADLLPHVPEILTALRAIQAGELVQVGI